MRRVVACGAVSVWSLAASAVAQPITAVKPVTSEVAVYSPSTPIGFENTSEQPVTFHWRLFAEGTSCGSSKAETIAPKGRLYSSCALDPRPSWWATGAFKPARGDAVLRVASSTVSAIAECTQCVDYSVKATLAYFPRPAQTIRNVVALLILLVIGGLFSHWITTTLPNVRRKARVGARLQRLRWDIRWTAADIDNDLPSRLSVERSRLTDQLAMQPSWGNDTADVLTSIETELTALEQHAAVLSRIIGARDRLRRAATTTFRRRAIDSSVRPLLARLASAGRADELAAFADQVANLAALPAGERDADFETWCTERAAALAPVIGRILQARPASLSTLTAASAALSTPLEPRAYADRELCLMKLSLLERFERLPAETRGDETSRTWLEGLDAVEDVSKLASLTRVVVELETRRTLDELCATLTARDIRIHPAAPRALEPVVVEFNPSSATARQLKPFELEGLLPLRWWFCEGTAGDPTQWRPRFRANGPVVRCYFPRAGKFCVSLRAAGLEDMRRQDLAVELTVGRSRSRMTAQFGTQALGLIGAQLIAATAAFLGAWDGLLERDVAIAVVAALAAGYGADTLKSAGAAIVSRLKGTDRPPEEKKQVLARAAARLEE